MESLGGAVAWDNSAVLEPDARNVWVPELWGARTVMKVPDPMVVVEPGGRDCPPARIHRFWISAVMF